ncbi:SUKH-3 domain-containing protein [Brevibacillus sp. NPDC003359]|uniref:SUKH-3 domain-containing protein n=1 Tax=unclassified Brevibacillus TaxID=2684853 RepID=UPI003695F898
MSNETMMILRNAGWYEGRNIDTKEIEEHLEKLGFIIYPEVKKFLIEFGDLVIEDTINDETHKTGVKIKSSGAFKAEEKYAQENLVPVGFIDSDNLVLFVSESGKVYCSTGKLGDNAKEAWENLIGGSGYKPWGRF